MSDIAHTRFVVIGAGLAGAAAAWHLASRGEAVILVERDEPASQRGSSHGSARIFRYAYADDFAAQLVVRARPAWDRLEQAAGRALITPSGALDFGALRDTRHLAGVLERAGVEHQIFSAEEAEWSWPQLSFDTDVLWHPAAGVIDAIGTVVAMTRLAVAAGAQLRSGWEATTVRRTGAGYTVTGADGTAIEGQQVIVAAGGWLPALLAELDLDPAFRDRLPDFEVRQENAFHFPYRDPAHMGETQPHAATSWPTFIYKSELIEAYALPGGRDAGFRGQKVAEYNGGRVIGSAHQQDGRIDPHNRARVVRFVERFAPDLVPETYAETTCLFTNTPGSQMIVDRADGITIVSPCSGQGAKFAPLLGEIVADLVTDIAAADEHFRAAGTSFARAAASD